MEDDTPLAELSTAERPCVVCVYDAVTEGVDYEQLPSDASIVGSTFDDGKSIHQAVTLFAGTDVCWYHVVPLAHAAGYPGSKV